MRGPISSSVPVSQVEGRLRRDDRIEVRKLDFRIAGGTAIGALQPNVAIASKNTK